MLRKEAGRSGALWEAWSCSNPSQRPQSALAPLVSVSEPQPGHGCGVCCGPALGRKVDCTLSGERWLSMSSALLASAGPHLAEITAMWLVPTWAWPGWVKSCAQTAPDSGVNDGGGRRLTTGQALPGGFWLSAGGLPQAHLRDRDLHLPPHLEVGKDGMLSILRR